VTLPAGLEAGTRMVRVQRMVTFPGETQPRPGFTSSPAPFQLLPAIQDTSPIQAAHGSSLTLTVSPAVGRTQQVTVYVGDQGIPLAVPAPGAPASSTAVTVPVPSDIPLTGTAAGAGVPIRVEVDGASSPLTQAGGQWAPLVQVT
jgi:hypothetical protein